MIQAIRISFLISGRAFIWSRYSAPNPATLETRKNARCALEEGKMVVDVDAFNYLLTVGDPGTVSVRRFDLGPFYLRCSLLHLRLL